MIVIRGFSIFDRSKIDRFLDHLTAIDFWSSLVPSGPNVGGRKGVRGALFLGESLRSLFFEGESRVKFIFRPLRGLKFPRSPYGDRFREIFF